MLWLPMGPCYGLVNIPRERAQKNNGQHTGNSKRGVDSMNVRWTCKRCIPTRKCGETFNLQANQHDLKAQTGFEIVMIRVECPAGHPKLVRVD